MKASPHSHTDEHQSLTSADAEGDGHLPAHTVLSAGTKCSNSLSSSPDHPNNSGATPITSSNAGSPSEKRPACAVEDSETTESATPRKSKRPANRCKGVPRRSPEL
jgi:hypothetical protein